MDELIRTCLYGGSFNPPHVCHVMATAWALGVCPVDEVWWIPTWNHAFGKDLVEFNHRVTMCELAVKPLGGLAQVCPIESELGGESRTIDTLRELQRRHPDRAFSLLIGADILPDTSRWKEWETLQRMIPVYVLGRSGISTEPDPDPSLALPDVSSSRIREALARGDEGYLTSRVPANVLAYLQRHRLYPDAVLDEAE